MTLGFLNLTYSKDDLRGRTFSDRTRKKDRQDVHPTK